MSKTYNERITTPFGLSLWAHVNEPDTKFNADGDFKINLELSESDAAPLIEQIQKAKEAALIKFQEDAKAEGKTAKAISKIKLSEIDPYAEDDEDEDKIIFKFKRRASFTKDSGEKTYFDVPLHDSTGKVIKDKPAIGNGSTVRVMAELIPYHMATSGVGISLRLSKVQIKNLVEFSTDGPGFDACEDGGYVPPGMEDSFEDAGGDSGYTV